MNERNKQFEQVIFNELQNPFTAKVVAFLLKNDATFDLKAEETGEATIIVYWGFKKWLDKAVLIANTDYDVVLD